MSNQFSWRFQPSMFARKSILSVLIGLMGGGIPVLAQESPAPPPAAIPADTTSTPSAADPAAQARPLPVKASAPAKKGKEVYTGPTTVVTAPATPMLDGEGKQRIDPDGSPMFNPAVKQIRNKKGHPQFDAGGKPVFETANNLGFDEKGKKIGAKKVKPEKMTPVSIAAGTLTVDGWTGKARLNYDIANLKYLYIYAPAIGTTIVSQSPFPGAKEQPGAFTDKTLHVTVDGHPIEVYSEKSLLGKKPRPAWVMVDRGFQLPVKFPALGYGATVKAPYMWPGAKNIVASEAPPLPNDLRPTLLLAACPAGMMRLAAPQALPGQKAKEQPCVPINSAANAASPTSTSPPASPATQVP